MAATLFRSCGRSLLATKSSGILATRSSGVFLQSCTRMCTMKYYKQMDEFWKKNRELERPLSPHLSIYKPQLTSMLSLCHRITGIVMVVGITGASIILLCLPCDFPTYLNMVKELQLGPVILTAVKYVLAFPVCYHFINGIRHLAWDWALGFGLQFLYKSGWFAFALAWVVASIFVFLPISKE